MSTPSGSKMGPPTAFMSTSQANGKALESTSSPHRPSVSPLTPQQRKDASNGEYFTPVNKNATPGTTTSQQTSTPNKPQTSLAKSLTTAFLNQARGQSSKQGGTTAAWDSENIPDTPTSSEDDADGSDWADADDTIAVASDNDAAVIEVDSSGKATKAAPKSKNAAGKQPVKRAPAKASTTAKEIASNNKRPRTLSDGSSSGSGAKAPPAKRVRPRTSAIQRQGPTAKDTTPLANGQIANFTSTVYIIQLGPSGRQFHAHESLLMKSPKFVDFIAKARSNKRSTRQNLLTLPPQDPVAFEQMMSYLYSEKFTLSPNKDHALQRLSELHDLFSLAGKYGIKGLQEQVVRLFSKGRLVGKITAHTFFEWAEDMYEDELEGDGEGAFRTYFLRTAPVLLRGLGEEVSREVGEMVKNGGSFGRDLFLCSQAALKEVVPEVPIEQHEISSMDTDSGDSIL